MVRRQQRGGPVLQHHQGAAERREGAPGDQRRDQPAAAGRPRASPDNEPPATSSSGHAAAGAERSCSTPRYANDLSATSNTAKVSSLLTSDGYAKVGGYWKKNGQKITFSIEDPVAYTDYATDAQLIATQLNAAGFDASSTSTAAQRPDRVDDRPQRRQLRRRSSTGATRVRPRTTLTTTGWTTRCPRRSARPPGADYRPVRRPGGPGGADAVRGRHQHRAQQQAARPRWRASRPPQVPVARCCTARPGPSSPPATTPAGRRPVQPVHRPGAELPEILAVIRTSSPSPELTPGL